MFMSSKASGLDKFLMYVPVFAAVVFGYFGWLSLGLDNFISYVPEEERVQWDKAWDFGLPFAEIMLLIHTSIVWRVCKIIPRYLEIENADKNRYKNMRLMVAIIGVILVLADAFIVHIGAEWLLKSSGINNVHEVFIFAGSVALSVYNVGGEWVFNSDLEKKPEPVATISEKEIENLASEIMDNVYQLDQAIGN